MPFGGALSLGAAGIGLASGLGSLFGGTPASKIPTYNFQNMPGADIGAFTGIQNLGNYNIGAGYLPQYQGITQNLVNNPYAGGYQQAANTTGGAGFGAGAALTGTSLSTLPDVQALMNLGFDPQQALYHQLQNTNQQQNLAMLNQSGVGSTPYGQGVAEQANNLFNINWENAQLGRAAQASGAAGNLLGAAGSGATTGLNQMTAGGALPYSTYSGINTDALAALSGATGFGQQVAQIPQQQISDYLGYLGQGAQQQGVNNQTAGLQFGQSQQIGNQIGQSLAGLSKNPALNNWFGSPTGTFSFGNQAFASPNMNSNFYGPLNAAA